MFYQSIHMFSGQLQAFLSKPRIARMSTIGSDGYPHTVAANPPNGNPRNAMIKPIKPVLLFMTCVFFFGRGMVRHAHLSDNGWDEGVLGRQEQHARHHQP